MNLVEAQFVAGTTTKTKCDFCGEVPENSALIEKPNSMIVNGQLIISQRAKPIFICLDCLSEEIETI